MRTSRVHHAAGMGFLAERCENVTLKRFDVTPSPGTGRRSSAAADAAHFVNCGGKVALEGCRFENQLDDGLNVHGFLCRWCAAGRARAACCWTGATRMQRGVQLAREGDVLALMQANSGPRPGMAGKGAQCGGGQGGKNGGGAGNAAAAAGGGPLGG